MGSLSDYYLLPPSQAPKPDTLSDQQKDKDNDKDKDNGYPHHMLQNLTPSHCNRDKPFSSTYYKPGNVSQINKLDVLFNFFVLVCF